MFVDSVGVMTELDGNTSSTMTVCGSGERLDIPSSCDDV